MKISDLSPSQFENLTFDLLQAAGLKSLVWRTPGADGGRDIEGVFEAADFSNYYHHQRWYIECKLYSYSLDWPTVWKKISYADSRGADFLLIVTNSNPSPACETEISNWNANKNRLIVRAWRGYELDYILSNYPAVAGKYGLIGKSIDAELSLQGVMLEVMKTAQASHVAHQLGQPVSTPLEAGAALAELVSARQDQLRTYGRIVSSKTIAAPPDFDWLRWTGPLENWEEVGIRSLLTMVRYITGSETVVARSEGASVELVFQEARFPVTPTGEKTLAAVALWANIELTSLSNEGAMLNKRG
ncbi:restriction endonuclease [Mesorhizobium sp. AR10]|uniref:restriction endonuclease n=1 Tax=Mesorhizobium sp. AR10 TaxID=2865839 RepID=UPI002160052A|nr:restriction endonuclease [Mesorhizobium sp. AR10]UVK37846.1 restriction endonuclease [Mesorhizobium sp. AR10]